MLEVAEIEVWKLKPWEDNPRLNEEAVDAVERSIRSFGFNVPILCNKDFTIIAGHTRWKAARRIGMKTVPVIVLQMTGAQQRAFAVADNKTAEIADWDWPKIQEVLEKLRSEDVDLSSLGYSCAELEALLTPEEDFNWDAFDLEAASDSGSAVVLLPVKIQLEMKEAFKEAVEQYAEKLGISGRDSAIVAGKVLGCLLGLSS